MLGRHNNYGNGISTLHSHNRHRSINAVKSGRSSGTPGTVANRELDTHADTCVAGPNFRIDEFTGEYCDETPFSNEYKPMIDVPIVNASTAFTNDEGLTVILRFNQVLWYGTKLSVSLIIPNQIRYHGLTVSDHPTDKSRFFRITCECFQIPFKMAGTTVFFQSRETTRWELENCTTIELTRYHTWDPHGVIISGVDTRPGKKTDMETERYRQDCAFTESMCHTKWRLP